GSGNTAPDPQVAAGPNHIVEMANTMVEIFSKQGVSLKNSTFATFFNVSSSVTLSDPRVIYDKSSERWFATIQIARLAVSNSSDPTGPWKVYDFISCSGDNPSLGVNDDKVVISSNVGGTNSAICII